MARVHLTQIRLTGFRNYEAFRLDCDRRHVVLTGENGAGKTNLLEAISFLSPGRGLRRASLDQIGRLGAGGIWSVFAQIEGSAGPVSVGTGVLEGQSGPEAVRRVRINGSAARTSDELLDHARIVWLTPAMDGLFTGPASDRRKFLDRLVLALDPAHGRRAADFEKGMRQRNRLLSEHNPDPRWLDAIEAQMVETGAAIAAARAELVGLLERIISADADPASPFPDAELGLDGTLESLHGSMPSAEIEDRYRAALSRSRRADAAAGRTLEGPHRSDLRVVHGPKGMPAETCSTGEQKALLIGLLLAHARLVSETSGHAPLLLLDEVAAHLDDRRRAALFDRIEALDCQAWLTGTDRSLFAALGPRAQYWTISGGRGEREDDAR